VDFGIQYPNHYKVTFMQSVRPEAQERYRMEDSMGHRAFDRLCSLVQACVEEGIFAEQDTSMISHSLWASAHGLTSLLILNRLKLCPDTNRLIDLTIESTVNGFRPQIFTEQS